MNRYTVIIEQGDRPDSFGAYVPDLPGFVAVGGTVAEVEDLIRGAIEMHLEGMREDGLPIPVPRSTAAFVEVATS